MIPREAEQQRVLALADFRREVEDKFGVVFHGCKSLPLQREITRKQCEDFIVELYAAALLAQTPAQTAEEWEEIDRLCERYPTLGAVITKLRQDLAAMTAERDEWRGVVVPQDGAFGPDTARMLLTAVARQSGLDAKELIELRAENERLKGENKAFVTENGRLREVLDLALFRELSAESAIQDAEAELATLKGKVKELHEWLIDSRDGSRRSARTYAFIEALEKVDALALPGSPETPKGDK